MKRLLFIGTYSVRHSKGIYACEMDNATGALKLLKEPDLSEPAINPTFLATRGNWLYAVGELSDSHHSPGAGCVTGFQIIGNKGVLHRDKSIPCGKGAPCHVLVFNNGRRLALSQYSSGELYIVALAPDGSPHKLETMFKFEAHGPVSDRQAGPHIHSAYESPDARFLFSCDLGSDRIYRYRILKDEIDPLEPLVCPPGSGPRHMTMSSDGRFLWAVGELDSSVIGFQKDGDHYALSGHWPMLPSDFKGKSYSAEIRLHPNGRWLYATNRGIDDITFMELKDGTPVIKQRMATSPWPRGMILSPDGRFLCAASEHKDQVDWFSIDQTDGTLQKRGLLEGIPSPVGFAFAE